MWLTLKKFLFFSKSDSYISEHFEKLKEHLKTIKQINSITTVYDVLNEKSLYCMSNRYAKSGK